MLNSSTLFISSKGRPMRNNFYQRYWKRLNNWILFACAIFLNAPITSAYAAPQDENVAGNLTQITSVFTGVFSGVFYIIGIMLFMAGVLQYREFRNNPSQTPLSRVIVLLISGILVGFFPLGSAWVSHRLAQFSV